MLEMIDFMQLLLLVLLLIRGACTSPVAVCIFCIFVFFSYTNYNKHNTVVVTTFKLVEIYQGLFLGGNGDDSRRRKSTWADWADRAHTGLRDTVEVDDDDYNADNPERCLCRVKTMGFAYGNQKELRRTFF